MRNKQGKLKDFDGNYVSPVTTAALVYDAAKDQALSQTLYDTPDRNALGFPAFSTVTAYAEGDIVFYNNKLWKFTADHDAGAWNAAQVEAYSVKDFVDDSVPEDAQLADNLKSWAERDALSVNDTFVEPVRTTAGDTSIVSDAGARIVSIVAKADFYASQLRATGFNLLHGATGVGDGFYFLVPALAFGTYGTALKPNGVLFTSNAGQNLTPTVRFKALSAGVPSSVNDGSACAYTDSNGHRFYTTDQPGYMIVSGITLAQTCAHVGWSSRYDEFVSPTSQDDAGSSITLSSIIHAIHDFDRMLVVGTIADRIDFGSTKATWTRRVDRVKPTWANTDNGDGTHTHTATIATMAAGGVVVCGNISFIVDGTTISYTDANAEGTTDWVKFELATPATGQVTISPALASVEDWGLEVLDGVVGSAYVTMQYAQGYPDSVAALVAGVNNAKLQVLVEALVSIVARVQALEVRQDRLGKATAESIDANEITRYRAPMVLYAHGVPAENTVPVNWPAGLPWDGIPYFVGQLYINLDAASAGVYYAINNTAVSGWKNA